MRHIGVRKVLVILVLGLLGWALCAATMGFGIAYLGVQTALVVHAIAAPVFFAAISAFYFSRLAYTGPLATAAGFLAIVVFMDVFVVATLTLHSFAMFASFIGTWLPFALIFAATWTTGLAMRGRVSPSTA